jgi:hypothetical protein
MGVTYRLVLGVTYRLTLGRIDCTGICGAHSQDTCYRTGLLS